MSRLIQTELQVLKNLSADNNKLSKYLSTYQNEELFIQLIRYEETLLDLICERADAILLQRWRTHEK